jgi:ABC-type branched-subunit amino acid transport system substrate-binding protein
MQAEILGNYISRNLPKATIAILNRADYIGAQFLAGFYTGLGMEHARSAITNMDDIHLADQSGNRVARVSGSNSDILAIFGTADTELELLREMTKLKWRPLLVMNDAVLTLELNQVDTSAGIITLSDHPRTNLWTVAELTEWDAFRKTYLSGREPDSSAARYSYVLARSMVTMLQSVGGELTPERLIDAYNRIGHETLTLMSKPLIDLVRFNGKTWDVIESDVQHFQDNTRN